MNFVERARPSATLPTPSSAREALTLVPRGVCLRPGYDRAVNDPLFDLTGRVAVVTGGMGQLGAELAVGARSARDARRDPRPRDRTTRRARRVS